MTSPMVRLQSSADPMLPWCVDDCAAVLGQFLAQRFRAVAAGVVAGCDRRALRGETAADRRPDAAGAAGDEGHPADELLTDTRGRGMFERCHPSSSSADPKASSTRVIAALSMMSGGEKTDDLRRRTAQPADHALCEERLVHG